MINLQTSNSFLYWNLKVVFGHSLYVSYIPTHTQTQRKSIKLILIVFEVVIQFIYGRAIFVEFGLLESNSNWVAHPSFNAPDSIYGICTKYKLDAFILDTKLYFFDIVFQEKKQIE